MKACKRNITSLIYVLLFFITIVTGCSANNPTINVNNKHTLEQQITSNQSQDNGANDVQKEAVNNSNTSQTSKNNNISNSSSLSNTEIIQQIY